MIMRAPLAVQSFCLWKAANQKKVSLKEDQLNSFFQTVDELRGYTKAQYGTKEDHFE